MTAPTTTATDWPTSALRAADAAFAALTCDPDPLVLDYDALAADADGRLRLPPGEVPLPVVRDWLLRHPYHYPERDAVWRELLRRARLPDPAWVIAAVGMAMPALVRFAGRLAADWGGDPDDVDAEVLAGFLQALRDRVDLSAPTPYAGLCFAAWRAGRAMLLQQHAFVPVPDIEHTAAAARAPRPPYGHPDLLVARAARLGLIDPADAAAYIEIKLGHRAIEPVAAALGVGVDMLRMRLRRADTRLAEALASGLLTGVVSVEAARQLAASAAHRAAVRAGRAAGQRARGARPAVLSEPAAG